MQCAAGMQFAPRRAEMASIVYQRTVGVPQETGKGTPVVVFEPDIVLPAQLRYRSAISGEERLMLAVLRDALGRFQKYAFASDRYHRRLFREANEWIHDRDRVWPFSFENICDVLGIDCDYVRAQLERWKGRRVNGAT